MTFGDLYRDVYSRLALDSDDHSIYFDDISKGINDAIRETRIEYIQQGMGHEFTEIETLNSFTENSDYPFINSDTLSKKIMEDLPIEFTVLSSTCYTTPDTIEDSTQSFDVGDEARKGNKLYECVETFSNVNTFDLVFDPQDVRNYYRANGLLYNQGDIVFDSETRKYFKANTTFTNTVDEDGENNSNLDKLYWKEIGSAFVYASHYPFKYLNTIKLYESIEFSEAFSILEDTVYATPNVAELRLMYIPKWTDVVSLDATLDLPDFIIPQVKDRALIRLGQKLGVKMDLLTEEQEDNE